MNGLPACVCSRMPHIPDGRTVLTEPEALNGCNGSVAGTRRHLPPFIPDTNAIEALNRQLRKAIKTKGSFPIRGRRPQARLPRPAERGPAMDPNPELDRRAAGLQDPLR